uniref:Bradykinin-potentiating peptide 11g n=2 Tax=Bothrops TaxID=8721 RepID=BPPBG_BOTJA|nr:RecName: Full=Bradykinin-potentiating peptide 11g; Short=BPP-11g [Bothrops fonsecai]P0DL01.1 RecName: Full=Bradykinin-potentiating peptide 11g; Short=BPP-11g [Bothrops jararaca]
QARPRHPKIPP